MKNGIKVLLVYANSPMDNLIPIGVSLLSACLKSAGHEVRLFDTTFYRTCDNTGDDVRIKTLQVKYADLSKFGIVFKETDMVMDFKDLVEEYKPDLIGYSCVEPTLNIAITLLDAVKDKKIPSVLGGMGVMFFRDDIFREEAIDMICVGEGEGAVVELADAIRDKLNYSQIKNLWVRSNNGGIVKNPIRPLADINNLPFQDWSIYEKERFYKPMGGNVRITGAFEFARGCPRMCAYCCNWGINIFYKGKYVRRKEIPRIIQEIDYAKKEFGIQYVYFYAENFLLTLNGADFDNFIDAYKDIGLPFWIETEPDSVTEEKLKKLKSVGCEGVSVGVEHGNERFRKEVLNRHISNDTLLKAFDIAKRSGIRISSNNIIGFPGETRQLIFDTIELNSRLKADNVIVNLFSPYRGMRLRDVAVERGYINNDVNAGDYRTSAILRQPQLPHEELMGLHRTFVLYVSMPKSKWSLIEKAEKLNEEGNRIFDALTKEYWQSKS